MVSQVQETKQVAAAHIVARLTRLWEFLMHCLNSIVYGVLRRYRERGLGITSEIQYVSHEPKAGRRACTANDRSNYCKGVT